MLVHESTHVYEFWSDPSSWGDERGPVAAERTTLCSLLTLEALDRLNNPDAPAASAGVTPPSAATSAPGV